MQTLLLGLVPTGCRNPCLQCTLTTHRFSTLRARILSLSLRVLPVVLESMRYSAVMSLFHSAAALLCVKSNDLSASSRLPMVSFCAKVKK